MKTAFVGCGNMGQALLAGMLGSGVLKPEEVFVSDPRRVVCEGLAGKYGVHAATDNLSCVENADNVFLCIKPGVLSEAGPELRRAIPETALILSILAGRTLEDLAAALGEEKKLVRCMPNTPVLVGEGIIGYCPNGRVTSEELARARRLLEGAAEAQQLPENLLKVITSLSGSSPAYVYMLIQAMADAGVAEGMPRDAALRFSAQTVLGSAKMVLATGVHPEELKDRVCSPGGTTIEGVAVLENKGFRAAVIEAVRAAVRKQDLM